MKKIAPILCAVLLCVTPIHTAAKANNWYFSSKGKNERPGLPAVDQSLAKGIGPNEKVLYLTFDAGYENGNVEKIVDILKENDVTGAFFVLKHFVEKNPELCKKIHDNHNLVCNHTANHPNITTLSEEALMQEIQSVSDAYKEVTGAAMDPYFRPPEGAWDEASLAVVRKAGYRTVFWSLAWADWDNNNQKSPEYAMEKLTTRVHPGAVILLHPTSQTNVKILGELILRWKAEGYRFGRIDELWQDA